MNLEPYPNDLADLFTPVSGMPGVPTVNVRTGLLPMLPCWLPYVRISTVRSVVSPGYAVAIEEKLSRVPPVMTDLNWSRLVMVSQFNGAPVGGETARYYKQQLKQAPVAIDYLKGRGLTGEVAARFALGYAPDNRQNLASVFPEYLSPVLAECGLDEAGIEASIRERLALLDK